MRNLKEALKKNGVIHNTAIAEALSYQENVQKDVALATAYFSSLYMAYGSFFNTIDRAYEMAVKFVEKYPPETNWGIEEDLEYQETLEAFFTLYYVKV